MYTFYGNTSSQDIIVAIPALGERKEMFKPLANQMNSYKWLVFDSPGSHQQNLEDYSIATFCAYIQETLEALQISKAHFIGNSLGAWVIQAFTKRYPQYVRSLALLDGGHYFLGERGEVHEDTVISSPIEDFKAIEAAIHELTYSMPQLEQDCYDQFEAYFLHNYPKQGDSYKHHCSEIAYNALSKELITVNHCLTERSIPVALLIAEASADELSLQKMRAFSERFDNAHCHIVKNGQHYLPLTNTGAVAEILTLELLRNGCN